MKYEASHKECYILCNSGVLQYKVLILSCNTFCCCPIRKYSSLRKRYVRLLLSGEGSMQQQQQQQQQQRFAFHSDRESSVEPLTPGTGMYDV